MLNSEEFNEKLSSLKQQMLNASFKNPFLQPEKLALVSPKLAQDLTDRQVAQRGHLVAFFRALAVCPPVLANRPEPDRDPYRLEYKTGSPDEAALVAAARDVGIPFINKGWMSSTRKRMIVAVRNPDGKLVLYTKGADSTVGGEEYLNWSRTYDNATNAIENRDEEIDKANELIEHALQILGAAALEDKGFWRLSRRCIGLESSCDKLQAAIEIGYSCDLLKQQMDVMILSAETAEVRAQIEAD
ncbi:hypothetical protein BT96DRAFT_1010193 [Gymnopus androsaceus JB14]|uniref:Uncharacterized protein n=1 Tax=Gymnopus androsaceus JB14 TaxID=1447944 RepID=A0A6A4GB23_9AGAR|nr:hypothetical protein BT96DRAFT_1010193 [Gymnopus androsaceus JB14]